MVCTFAHPGWIRECDPDDAVGEGWQVTLYQGKGGSWAVLSPDKVDRYVLDRRVGDGEGICLFVMLNPSTADALKDDPTIRRCMKFAKRWGYEEMRAVNLFAFRSPHPKDLKDTDAPMGVLNDTYLRVQATVADRVVCAWGNGNPLDITEQVEKLRGILPLERTVCLGCTQSGQPKHPLARGMHRTPDDFQPIPWS